MNHLIVQQCQMHDRTLKLRQQKRLKSWLCTFEVAMLTTWLKFQTSSWVVSVSADEVYYNSEIRTNIFNNKLCWVIVNINFY